MQISKPLIVALATIAVVLLLTMVSPEVIKETTGLVIQIGIVLIGYWTYMAKQKGEEVSRKTDDAKVDRQQQTQAVQDTVRSQTAEQTETLTNVVKEETNGKLTAAFKDAAKEIVKGIGDSQVLPAVPSGRKTNL